MPWLKLDDAMGEHRKTRRLLRVGGPAAFSLHTLALLHSARYLTDGHVDREFVDETLDALKVRGKARAAAVQALLECGQWDETPAGWLIHDYLDHNPRRADVEDKRRRDAERKARGRQAQSEGSPRGHDADNARTPVGVQSESDGPVPTRPDPEWWEGQS
jgi:hypothetical protein